MFNLYSLWFLKSLALYKCFFRNHNVVFTCLFSGFSSADHRALSLTPCYPISILSYENTDLTSFLEGILLMQVWDRNINIGLWVLWWQRSRFSALWGPGAQRCWHMEALSGYLWMNKKANEWWTWTLIMNSLCHFYLDLLGSLSRSESILAFCMSLLHCALSCIV